MFIGIVAFAAYSFATQKSEPERRYYEADASGRLVQVERPSTQAQPAPALWKPEPDLLLDHARRLKLTEAQRSQVAGHAVRWRANKSRLETEIQAVLAEATPKDGSRSSVEDLKSRLSGYTELSREYDAKRNELWREAVALLNPEQRETLLKLSKEIAR